MFLMHGDGKHIDLFPQQTVSLRKIWEEEGRPKLPDNLKPRIDKMIRARLDEFQAARATPAFERTDGESDRDAITGPKVE